MTTLAERPARIPERLLWALAACALGAAAGLVAAAGPKLGLLLAVLAIATMAAIVVLRRLDLGVILIALALPLDEFGRIIDKPVSITVFHFALLLALGAWMVHLALGTAPRPRVSWVDGGLLLLLFAAAWSLPNSADPSVTTFALIRITALFVMTVLFENVVVERKTLLQLLGVIVWLAVPMALLAVAQSFLGIGFGSFLGYGDITRGGALFDDPNFLGGYLSVAMAAAVAFMVFARDWRTFFIWSLPVLPIAAGLFASYSRSAWVGTVVAVATVVLVSPARRRLWLLLAGLALVVSAVAYAPGIVLDRFASSVDITKDTSVATRYYMNQSILEMIEDDPIWGTGLDAFRLVYPDYRSPFARIDITEPHQLPVAIVAEMGVAGLVAEVVLMMALAATIFWRRRPTGFRAYEAAVIAGLFALLTQTLFQYYLYFEYLWLYFALSVAASRIAAADDQEVSS